MSDLYNGQTKFEGNWGDGSLYFSNNRDKVKIIFSLPVFIDYGLSRDFIVCGSKFVVSKNVWIYSNVKRER